ncbi:MAG: hypothetical protein GY811_28735, partial [Myxococcales bacterium]|nr:hypothetical protein [Myxococcales bacterium]
MSDFPESTPSAPSMSLWTRRVPHIAGIYLAAAYTFFEMAQWVVKRYQLPIYYEDFSLITLLSLFPAVIILAWGHGAPGKDHWSPIEKLAIPANLVVTVLLLYLIPKTGPVPLEPTPSVVPMVQPAAISVEEAHPDAAIEMKALPAAPRKTILAFAFQDVTKETQEAWRQYAIPLALEIDLEQDPQ